MAVVFFATPIKSFHQFSSMSVILNVTDKEEGGGAVLQNSGKHKCDFQIGNLSYHLDTSSSTWYEWI